MSIMEYKAVTAVKTPTQVFQELLVRFCANQIAAKSIAEIQWAPLAVRLGVESGDLESAAEELGDGFWTEVINERVTQAGNSQVFKVQTWDNLEAKAMHRLMVLVDTGRVKDPSELLAIAIQAGKQSRPASTTGQKNGGLSVTINQNNGIEGDMSDSGLPPAGTRMSIDLSPRMADAISKQRRETESRVIDGDMLNASDLRALARGDESDAAETEVANEIDDFVSSIRQEKDE